MKTKIWWGILALLVIVPLVLLNIVFKETSVSPSPGVTVFTSYSSYNFGSGMFVMWLGAAGLYLFGQARFQRANKTMRIIAGMVISLALFCAGVSLCCQTTKERIIIDSSAGNVTVRNSSVLHREQDSIDFNQIDHIELTWVWNLPDFGGQEVEGVAYKECDVDIIGYGEARLKVVRKEDYQWSNEIVKNIVKASGKPSTTQEKD